MVTDKDIASLAEFIAAMKEVTQEAIGADLYLHRNGIKLVSAFEALEHSLRDLTNEVKEKIKKE
ncbi:hypothetical protein UFOVP1365_40 [uncultured Caudovirales phage]|uniref:Uncharacterized protein n=1 Tax=uncultured Caudovirales phage TaxID=2100421 RepID=A0A6J5S040_9CAUD|nr:hypothetical protein UFOVP1365_40 [uncultured Caudovirales phage]